MTPAPHASRAPGRRSPRAPATVPIQPVGARTIVVTLIALTAAHTLGLVLLFNPIAGAFNGSAVLEQDWGLHEFHLRSMLAFWHDAHRLWGYNPFFMAGYTSNTIQDLSVKLFELAAWAASIVGVDPIAAFKLAFLAGTGATPLVAYAAVRLFDPDEARAPVSGLVGAVAATIYWWAEYPREMAFYGMIGWSLACYVAVLAAALWVRLVTAPSVSAALGAAWLTTAALLVPLHLEAVFIVVLLAVPIAWPIRRRWRAMLGWVSITAAVVVAANAFWLMPFVRHLGDQNSTGVHRFVPLFVAADAWAPIVDYLTPGGLWTFRETWWTNALRWAILAIGVSGLVTRSRESRRDLAIALSWGAAALFGLTYLGSVTPWLVNLQPLRFKIALDLVLIAAGAPVVATLIQRPDRRRARRWVIVLAGAGVVASAIAIATTEIQGTMRLRTVMPPDEQRIVDWIATSAPKDARVLFEESGDESGFVHHGIYLSSLIPFATGRSLIGGPINAYNDRHFFAEFHSGLLFTHPAAALSPETIAGYLDAYNVGAIAAFSPQALQQFRSLSFVREEGDVGPVALFLVQQPLTWFLRGSGDARADLTGLRLSGVRGDDVLLKFHWTPDLRATPSVPLEAESVLDDPSPFIRIRHAPDTLTIK